MITETTTLREITLPLSTARSIGSMAVLLAPAKSVTPALELLKLSVSEYRITAYATDRYVLGRLDVDDVDDVFGVPGDYYLDAQALKLMASTKAGSITIKHGETHFTVSNYSTSVSVPIFLGTYPPIEGLIPETVDAVATGATNFNVNLLTKLTKLVSRDGKKIENWKLLPGGLSEFGKPNAWTAKAEDFTVLIQPRLGN